jgi:hypothetical protein
VRNRSELVHQSADMRTGAALDESSQHSDAQGGKGEAYDSTES